MRTFRALIKETSAGAAPYISRVLVNHTSEVKLNYIKYAMADVLSDRRERYDEPLEDQIDTSVEKAVSNYERFFGSLVINNLPLSVNTKRRRMIQRVRGSTGVKNGKTIWCNS